MNKITSPYIKIPYMYNKEPILKHNSKNQVCNFANSLIFKLIDKKYSNDFLNKGTMHWGTSRGYRQMELNENKRGYGDINEGTMNIGNNKYDNKITIDGIDLSNEEASTMSIMNPYIFSMTIINNINAIHSYSNKYKNNLIKELNNSLLSDKNHRKNIFWIVNPNRFFRKIQNSMSSNIHIIGNHVQYVNTKNKNKEINKLTQRNNLYSFENSNFIKNKFFQNQFEYRLLITGNYSNPINYSIGNLQDTVKKVNNFTEILY